MTSIRVGIASDLIEQLADQRVVVDGRLRGGATAALDRETASLITELESLCEDVVLVAPRRSRVAWERDGPRPRVWLGSREITDLHALIVRGTRGVEHEIHALVQGLTRAGCVVMDPVDRFRGQRATKIIGTIDRWDARVGTDSWIVGGHAIDAFLDEADAQELFPMIVKPLRGSRGEGVRLLEHRSAAMEALAAARDAAAADRVPLLFQRFVPFKAEWRVTVVNGRSIGVVRRVAPPGVITHNAATGATYEIAYSPDVASLAERCHSGPGIVGVDVALADDGTLHVIEGNWACQWGLFEDTTGVNVARAIARSLIELIEERAGTST